MRGMLSAAVRYAVNTDKFSVKVKTHNIVTYNYQTNISRRAPTCLSCPINKHEMNNRSKSSMLDVLCSVIRQHLQCNVSVNEKTLLHVYNVI